MAKLSILAGATSVSVNLFVQNSTSTTGAGLTAIAPAGGALLTGTKCYYTFAGANAASTAITLAVLATVGTAYTSGGIVTIDDTNLPGVVRLDLPNAVLAAAHGRSVLVMLSGGTNMAPCVLEIELTGWDNQDGVRGGMTALPNAAAAASGGLPTIGATIPNANAGASGGLIINGTNAGTVTLAALTITGATTHTGNVSMAAGLTITQSTLNGNGISVTGNGTGNGILATSGSGATGDGLRAVAASTNGNGITGVHSGTGFDLNCTTSPPLQVGSSAPTAAQVATAVWQDLTASADFTTAGSIGLLLVTNVNATISSRSTYAGGPVASVTGSVGGDITGKVLGGGASAFTAVGVQADVEQIGGAALAAHAAGMIPADVRDIVGAAVSTTTAQLGVNAVQIGGVAPASATIGTVTNVGTVTGNVTGSVGSVVARVTANTDQLAGQPITLDANNLLKVDVEDVNGASTLAELLQAQPPATPTLAQSVMLLYMTLRNQLTTTASQKSIYNSTGTLITKKALSDNGTTYTETTMVGGP